jgi:hypothetical protein
MSGGRTRPPAAPGRTRAGHRRGHGGRPGARPGSRPPQTGRRDGRPAPPARSLGHQGRRGSRRSWSAAGPHPRPARRCGHGGGPVAHPLSGPGPRTWPRAQPRMLRPPAPRRWRRRHTTGLGTHRGQTGTLRGRWPARGCNTPPGPPRAWRCRPPRRLLLPPALARANAPVVHCSSDDFGSSVERAAHGQVLWRAQMRADAVVFSVWCW